MVCCASTTAVSPPEAHLDRRPTTNPQQDCCHRRSRSRQEGLLPGLASLLVLQIKRGKRGVSQRQGRKESGQRGRNESGRRSTDRWREREEGEAAHEGEDAIGLQECEGVTGSASSACCVGLTSFRIWAEYSVRGNEGHFRCLLNARTRHGNGSDPCHSGA